MRVDCSEVKTLKECKRKHLFSSRNRFHVVPKKPADNLRFGTVWHDCLHELYLAKDPTYKLDEILGRKPCTEAGIPELERTLTNMLQGYYEGPFMEDIARYKVLDIERGFNIVVERPAGPIEICGSIDMVCVDKTDLTLVGFEHKSAKNFRPDVYDALDEQPRLYFWALGILWDTIPAFREAAPNGVKGILLNQVKKLITKFEYKRVMCIYSDNETQVFINDFIDKASAIEEGNFKDTPEPGYMKCQMCDYAPLCLKFGYAEPSGTDELTNVKDADGNELFEVRQIDHLDEKEAKYNS